MPAVGLHMLTFHFLFPDMETKLAMMYILVSVAHCTVGRDDAIFTISFDRYVCL